MKLIRTIRFDESDTRVFPAAAAPGEWAVPGAFVFADADPAGLPRRERQAFANGFLGLTSFGWSTLASVATIEQEEFTGLLERFARHLLDAYGAPGMDAAMAAARGELEYTAGLCDHPINTLLSLTRRVEGDSIIEDFRVVPPPGEAPHARIWEIVDDGDQA